MKPPLGDKVHCWLLNDCNHQRFFAQIWPKAKRLEVVGQSVRLWYEWTLTSAFYLAVTVENPPFCPKSCILLRWERICTAGSENKAKDAHVKYQTHGNVNELHFYLHLQLPCSSGRNHLNTLNTEKLLHHIWSSTTWAHIRIKSAKEENYIIKYSMFSVITIITENK